MSETKVATPSTLLPGSTSDPIASSFPADNIQSSDTAGCSSGHSLTGLPKEGQSAGVGGNNGTAMATAPPSTRKLQPGSNGPTAATATSHAFEQHRKLLTDIVQSTPIAGLSADAQRKAAEEALRDALRKSLQEQLAELSPEQKQLLQRRLVQQRIREHAKRKRLMQQQAGSNSSEVNAKEAATSSSSSRSPLTAQMNGKIQGTVLHSCTSCGKVYKHRNCLTKHRWEHHAAWEETKRFCQTKHQQVQVLEAAQMLAELTERSHALGDAVDSSGKKSTAERETTCEGRRRGKPGHGNNNKRERKPML